MGDTGTRREPIAGERYSVVKERAWRWALAGAGVGRSEGVYAWRGDLFGKNSGNSHHGEHREHGENSLEPQINTDGHRFCGWNQSMEARREKMSAFIFRQWRSVAP